MLYTLVLTVDLADDTEASDLHDHAVEVLQGHAEVVVNRWFRDLDAEVAAELVGVEWGGR